MYYVPRVVMTMVVGNSHNVFAEFVKEKLAGRSFRQIAAKAGVSPTTLSNIVSYGRIIDDHDILVKLAPALGVTYEELAAKAREAKLDPLRDIETALRRKYTDWPEEKRGRVMDRIKDILDQEEP